MKKIYFIFSVVGIVLSYIVLVQNSRHVLAGSQNKDDLSIVSISISPLQPAVNQPVSLTVTGKVTGPDKLYYIDGIDSVTTSFSNFFQDGTKTQGVISPQPSAASPLKDGDTFTYTYYGSFSLAGETRLYFVIDRDNQVIEWDEQNNTFTSYVTVMGTPDYPDLKAQSISITPSEVHVQEPVTIVVTGNYSGATKLLSAQGVGSVAYTFQDFTPTSSVMPSSSPVPSEASPYASGTSFTYTISGSFVSSGSKQLSFTIDSAKQLAESDETNNMVTTSINVSGSAITVSDVKVEHPSGSPDLAVISWTSTATGDSQVRYAETLAGLASASWTVVPYVIGTQNLQHSMTINSLKPGLTYYYEVRSSTENTIGTAYQDIFMQPSSTINQMPSTESPVTPAPATSNEIQALFDRLKRLGLIVTETERVLLEAERKLVLPINTALVSRFLGKILLQVEDHGEAWYVDPISSLRYYLRDGVTAYNALRAFGLGITTKDLQKIPVGIDKRIEGADTDADGLSDDLEAALGTDPQKSDTDGDGANDGAEVRSNSNPLGSGSMAISAALIARLQGRILLQVDVHGQAWYIYNGKRYYMKDGDRAYQLMRFLGVGIADTNLRTIAIGSFQ